MFHLNFRKKNEAESSKLKKIHLSLSRKNFSISLGLIKKSWNEHFSAIFSYARNI